MQDEATQKRFLAPWQATLFSLRCSPSGADRGYVVLVIQARVGWEFGDRVPKEVRSTSCSFEPSQLTIVWVLFEVHGLFSGSKNAITLPSVPEILGARLPSSVVQDAFRRRYGIAFCSRSGRR